MPELFRPAKELLLGARERDMRRELQLQKVKCADEVGNLEEPVTGWLYVNGEFNLATEACLESLMKKPRDRGLSTVIVYLDMVDGQKYIVAQGDEFGERRLEPFDDLLCGIDIPFIHRKAMVSIVNPSGKGHHAGELNDGSLRLFGDFVEAGLLLLFLVKGADDADASEGFAEHHGHLIKQGLHLGE